MVGLLNSAEERALSSGVTGFRSRCCSFGMLSMTLDLCGVDPLMHLSRCETAVRCYRVQQQRKIGGELLSRSRKSERVGS